MTLRLMFVVVPPTNKALTSAEMSADVVGNHYSIKQNGFATTDSD